MRIGQCRPLSISDSVPSTTQAGQSESEPSTCQPAADLVGDMVGLSVFRSSLASRLLRICVCQSNEDFRSVPDPSPVAGPNPDPDR